MLESLLVLSLFVFDGGHLTDFVQQYTATTKMNLVVAAYTPVPPMAFYYDQVGHRSQLDLNARYIAYRLGAELKIVELGKDNPKAACYSLQPKSLPIWFAPSLETANRIERYKRAYPSRGFALKKTETDPVMYQVTASGYSSVEDLTYAKFDKPVKAHWFQSQYNFVANGDFPTSRSFLEAVAFAVGGKLSDTGSSYYIDFDPVVYRKQLIAYYQEIRLTQVSDFDLAYTDFRIAAAKAFTDAQLIKCMSSNQSYAFFMASANSPVGIAAKKVIEAFRYDGMPKTRSDVPVNPGNQKTLDSCDLSAMQVVIYSDRGIHLDLLKASGDGGAFEF